MMHTASDLGAELSLPASAAVAMGRRFGTATVAVSQPWRDAARTAPPSEPVEDSARWDRLTQIAENLGLL